MKSLNELIPFLPDHVPFQSFLSKVALIVLIFFCSLKYKIYFDYLYACIIFFQYYIDFVTRLDLIWEDLTNVYPKKERINIFI